MTEKERERQERHGRNQGKAFNNVCCVFMSTCQRIVQGAWDSTKTKSRHSLSSRDMVHQEYKSRANCMNIYLVFKDAILRNIDSHFLLSPPPFSVLTCLQFQKSFVLTSPSSLSLKLKLLSILSTNFDMICTIYIFKICAK